MISGTRGTGDESSASVRHASTWLFMCSIERLGVTLDKGLKTAIEMERSNKVVAAEADRAAPSDKLPVWQAHYATWQADPFKAKVDVFAEPELSKS
jgi:hypothetical protein